MSQNADVDLLVAADDRTGAFEAAAVLADRSGTPVSVTVWPEMPSAAIAVVDLASRHLDPDQAAERAGLLPIGGRQAHKIDSTLRGNWAEELAARAVTRPVLLVPALPAMGRVCVDGMVLDHGRPVHQGAAGSDVRRPVRSSRPADSLAAAGATVTEVGSSLDEWFTDPAGVAVADAGDDAAIDRIVARWQSELPDVVLAGPSAVVGRAAHGGEPATFPVIDGPVLVVCGSVHLAARHQLQYADHHGVPVVSIADDITARSLRSHGALVLATEIPMGDVTAPMAVAAASSLARGTADLARSVEIGALVILGGDTAAAVLGRDAVVVRGTIGAGTAWLRADSFDAPVITRAGGFGTEHALLELIHELQRR
jgi:4-hydroxythreonine-4-phosphate dehydrogenase